MASEIANPTSDAGGARLALVVVSGLPRSGTSMMMRMLGAGGVPLLVDGARRPDEGNPHGYFELARVKRLRVDAKWLCAERGKAVKIVSPLLRWVPAALPVDLILMRRDVCEILASQHAMLARGAFPVRRPLGLVPSSDDDLAAIFAKHRAEVRDWIARREQVRVVEVEHGEALRAPEATAARVRAFLGLDLDAGAMVRAIDPALYRSRGAGVAGIGAGGVLPA